jgi:CHAT domain-containing protein
VTAQQRWARQARNAADPDTTRLLDRLRQVTRQIVGLSMNQRPAQTKSESNDLPNEIRTLSAKRDDLERQLTERSAVYRSIQARARVGSGEVRTALPKGSALIDLVDYSHLEPPAKGRTESSWEPRVVAFVVRPDRPEVVILPLGPSQALAKWIDRWRDSYGARKAAPGGETDPGVELRKRLWEPLAEHLRGVSVVLVSPDGPLNGLPWAALPGSKVGTFLVHEYAFAIVPVPQLLPELLRGKPRLANQQPSLLLAGGIDFGEANTRDQETPAGKLPPVPVYRPLPGTESEVNDLEKRFRRTFPQAPPPLVLGEDQATKQAILAALAAAPAYRFLHLATHGFFAGESESSILLAEQQRAALQRGDLSLLAGVAGRHPGLLSGLVFAGVNRSDRRPEETILTALEAADLELGQVELVVLSACNTGRGQVAGGEGVLGLQRAFQLAGARSVVASLWRVPDEETHQLMREFYRRVWSDKPVPRVEALRQAQLWMLENWKPRGGLERPAPQGPPPPYVWAAFVLSGDWR